MGFDYGHTCGEIDDHISDAKGNITYYVSDLLDECCPLLEGKQKDDFIKGYTDSIYDEISNSFEGVRKTNEDMRKEAENQIDNIERELDDCRGELSDANDRITELEQEVDELNETLDNS